MQLGITRSITLFTALFRPIGLRCSIVWGKPATSWYERSITGCRAGCLWQLLRQQRVFLMLLGVITLQGRAEATLRLRRPSELALVPSSEPHRFCASRTCCPAWLPTAATLTFMARAVPTACCWARPVKLPQPTIVYGRSRLPGLPGGRTQEFMTFVSNATRVGTALPTVPNLTLQVCVELTGAATCAPPAATTIGAVQGTGIVLPLLNPNSGLVFKVDCSVTATASRTSLACGNFPTPAI